MISEMTQDDCQLEKKKLNTRCDDVSSLELFFDPVVEMWRFGPGVLLRVRDARAPRKSECLNVGVPAGESQSEECHEKNANFLLYIPPPHLPHTNSNFAPVATTNEHQLNRVCDTHRSISDRDLHFLKRFYRKFFSILQRKRIKVE